MPFCISDRIILFSLCYTKRHKLSLIISSLRYWTYAMYYCSFLAKLAWTILECYFCLLHHITFLSSCYIKRTSYLLSSPIWFTERMSCTIVRSLLKEQYTNVILRVTSHDFSLIMLHETALIISSLRYKTAQVVISCLRYKTYIMYHFSFPATRKHTNAILIETSNSFAVIMLQKTKCFLLSSSIWGIQCMSCTTFNFLLQEHTNAIFHQTSHSFALILHKMAQVFISSLKYRTYAMHHFSFLTSRKHMNAILRQTSHGFVLIMLHKMPIVFSYLNRM